MDSQTVEQSIFRLSVSEQTGTPKKNVLSVTLKEDYGIVGDAHAGSKRQVSLLAYEEYEAFIASRNDIDKVKPGDFADNITTIGLSYENVKPGTQVCIGDGIRLEVTELGKSECHFGCPIRQSIGDCIMPRVGIFAKVLRGGKVSQGDSIRWSERQTQRTSVD